MGRGLEVACNDVCIIFHGDFPELAQQLLGNVAPLRCRVAQVRRDGCVRTVSLLRRSPEPCLKQKVFQAEGVVNGRALDFFLDFHTLGFKGALVVSDELACTPVDVKLLLRACVELMVVRLRLLDHDHMERSHHAACNVSSLRSRVPA